MLANDLITGQLVGVLREACDGPPHPWSYFTDSGPQAGFLGCVAALSPRDASKIINGSSVAAHVHHVIFGLNASAAWIRGDHNPRDWKESWSVQDVDSDQWAQMQADLRAGLDGLRQAITFHCLDSAHSFGGAVGAIAHLAYHLGAIKQKNVALQV
jgi:hypothetical protein